MAMHDTGHPHTPVIENAEVLEFRWMQYDHRNGSLPWGIVLAKVPDSPYPYVTWQFVAKEDGTFYCVSGHYDHLLEAARVDYDLRLRRGY